MKNNTLRVVAVLIGSLLLLACSHPAKTALKDPPVVQEDLSVYKTADDLWNHTGSFLDSLDIDPGKADAKALSKAQSSIVLAQASAQKFIDTYPKDDRRWQAHILILKLEEAYADFGMTPVSTDVLQQQISSLAQAPDAPPTLQASLESRLIAMGLEKLAKQPDASALAALDVRIAAFEKKFGDVMALGENAPPEIASLRLQQLQFLVDHGSDDQIKALMVKIKALPIPQLAAYAQQIVDQGHFVNQIKQKPLDLKFTAADGRVVDLSQLRGKVVLLDFWATWCGPCVQEMPNVVAAYQKFHGQGLEVVGVSLDQSKEQMQDFTQKNGMVWPQFFDGQGWQNALAQQYQIKAIPAMWLIDKKGQLRETDARDDLETKISQLLAE